MSPADPGYDRTLIDSNPQADLMTVEPTVLRVVPDSQSQLGNGMRVIGPCLWYAGGNHVRISDGLDLLETQLVDEATEGREYGVQQPNQLRR